MAWSLVGKRILVTGATRGIGRAAALSFAREGAEVVIVARDRARGEETLAAIRDASPERRGELLLADLSLVREVRRLASEVRERFDRLDVLVNNAGAIFERREVTDEGLERTFATNHVAYFVLTTELLELLKRSAPARIVNVASRAHRRARIDFGDLQTTHWTPWRAYGRSKLANVLFTRELARRLAGSGVTVNAMHPGVVATNFAVEGRSLTGWLFRLAAPILRTPEQGARTLVHLVAAPQLEGVTGQYFADAKPVVPSAEARDDAVARRLWEETERLVTSVPP